MSLKKREEILNKAAAAISGERDEHYGSPEDNFSQIAVFWTNYLHTPITSTDVANMMILLKMSRAMNDPSHEDNWIDIAGYAACAGEINE